MIQPGKVENYSYSQENSNTKPSTPQSKTDLVPFEDRRRKAMSGNAEEALFLGLDLMLGAWSSQRMEDDMCKDQLIPVPTNPSQPDPYIYIPKDPVQGVKFLEMAAGYNTPETSQRALYFLAICRFYGLGGLPVDKSAIVPLIGTQKDLGVRIIASRIENQLTSPMERPNIENPNKALFQHLGKRLLKIQLFHIILAQLFALAPLSIDLKHYKLAICTSLIAFVFFSLPMIIYMLLIKIYAINRGLPACSCSKMRTANASIQRSLKQDCRQKENPFTATPFIVRNLFTIKRLYFWLLSLLSVALTVCSFVYMDQFHDLIQYLGFESSVGVFVPITGIFGFLLCLSALVFDMDISKIVKANFFVVCFKALISPFQDKDAPCQIVHDKVFKK